MKVLIVDESATARRTHAAWLKAFESVETLEARSSEEAFAHLESNDDVDVVLTDLDMPRVSALDFIKQLTGHQKFGQIPVVVVAANSEKVKVIEAIRAGARNFLVKPYTPEALREKIGQLLADRELEVGPGPSA